MSTMDADCERFMVGALDIIKGIEIIAKVGREGQLLFEIRMHILERRKLI
jgi:hypothetical protein